MVCIPATSKARILGNLKKSVETWDFALMEKSVDQAMKAGIPAEEIIEEGLGKGMESISRLFDNAKIYLPQVMAASRTVEGAMKKLEPILSSDAAVYRGTIIMGSVEGDIHEIGKNVCCAMLRGAGYKVIDLGSDVSPDDFLNAAEENSADVIGASALMTTTLQMQKRLVQTANERQSTVMMIFGGAPCSKEWVEKIGGDGYSASGTEIVTLVNSLMSRKGRFCFSKTRYDYMAANSTSFRRKGLTIHPSGTFVSLDSSGYASRPWSGRKPTPKRTRRDAASSDVLPGHPPREDPPKLQFICFPPLGGYPCHAVFEM